MLDAQDSLSLARQGRVPSTWKLFKRKRSRIDDFFSGTGHDPDPLLIFTPEAVITYVHEKKPLRVIAFAQLSGVTLQARGSYLAAGADPVVWIELHYQNGKKEYWSGGLEDWGFTLWLEIVQYFLEAYAHYKAFKTQHV